MNQLAVAPVMLTSLPAQFAPPNLHSDEQGSSAAEIDGTRALPDCVLWSGGKDCFLAFLSRLRAGATPEEILFITFVPQEGYFRCHPMHLLERQSRFLGVRHEFIVIDPAEGPRSYHSALAYAKRRFQIRNVISGDILASPGNLDSYWLREICESLELRFSSPLTNLFAEDVLEMVDTEDMEVLVTGLSKEFYRHGILGRRLSTKILHDASLFYNSKFDICGERGEYHTTVLRYGSLKFGMNPLPQGHALHGSVWALDWSSDWLLLRRTRTIVAAE